MKYKTGLVIGRFQPFHLGHKFLIEKALEVSENIIIGIGSSNITNKSNPYNYSTRKKFLEKFIKKENLFDRVLKIIPIVDHPDDGVWLKKLLKKTGPIDVVIGDNSWVSGIFENADIPVVRPGHYKREILEGTKIRELINKKKNWQERVPQYLARYIEESRKKIDS